MHFVKEEFESRLNSIVNYSNICSGNNVKWKLELSERGDLANDDGAEYPLQEFLIRFREEEKEQTFHDFSDAYSSYSELMSEIAEAFNLSHWEDAIIDSDFFDLYTENLHKIMACASIKKKPIIDVVNDLDNRMTRQDYCEAICLALEEESNPKAVLADVVSWSAHRIGRATLKSYIYETAKEDFESLKVFVYKNGNMDVTDEDRQGTVPLQELFKTCKKKELLDVLNRIMDSLDDENCIYFFGMILRKFPKEVLEEITNNLEISKDFRVFHMNEKTVEAYTLEKADENWEEKYYSIISSKENS